MIKVEIINIKGCEAELNIKTVGEKEVIYNELTQLFIHLMRNEETAEILIAALSKITEVS